MGLFNMTDLCAALGPQERLLGIDPGRRTIGLALSDVRRRVAGPYGTIRRGKLRVNATEILTIAAREEVGGLVVGFPLDEEGRMGPAAQAARDWARDLAAATGLPAAMWDERDTTADAHGLLIGAADLGRKRRGAVVDRVAASLILQAALDHTALALLARESP